MGTWGPFPGGKERPGRDADHSLPSSAEVKNVQELYLLSPQAPPWRVAGRLYFYFYFLEMAYLRSVKTLIFYYYTWTVSSESTEGSVKSSMERCEG
jgi:hypothetical protein